MIVFYFTGTGNSLAVAKHIGGDLISIANVADLKNQSYIDDVIGIVFPIHWLTVPKIVRRFLGNVIFKASYTFAIGTCGNMPGAAMMSAQKLAQAKGNSFNYTNYLRMLDNYLPLFDVESEIKKLPSKKVSENTTIIADDIRHRKQMQVTASLGFQMLTGIFNATVSPEKKAKNYLVNSNCNTCGICAKVCPAKNINVKDSVSFNDHCEGCFACLHHCGQNALHLKKEKSDLRWRNPEISLNEIIDANNRFK